MIQEGLLCLVLCLKLTYSSILIDAYPEYFKVRPACYNASICFQVQQELLNKESLLNKERTYYIGLTLTQEFMHIVVVILVG